MKVAAADIPPQSIKNSCMNVYIPTVAVRDATEEVTTKAIGNSFHENTSIRRAVVSVPGLSRYGLDGERERVASKILGLLEEKIKGGYLMSGYRAAVSFI